MSFNYCVIVDFHKAYMSRITRQHKGIQAHSQKKKSRIFKGSWKCWQLLDSCLWSDRRRAVMIRKLHDCELFEAQTCAKTWLCISIRPWLWSVTQANTTMQSGHLQNALACPPDTDTHTNGWLCWQPERTFAPNLNKVQDMIFIYSFIYLFYLIASIQCGFRNLISSVVAPQHNQWTDSVGHTFSAVGLSFG